MAVWFSLVNHFFLSVVALYYFLFIRICDWRNSVDASRFGCMRNCYLQDEREIFNVKVTKVKY